MRRHEFLKSQIEWANKVLTNANVRYPNGRMSHEAAREILEQSTLELEDLALAGNYTIDQSGQLRFHSFND